MTKTPHMITGTVEMVPVVWILQNISQYIDTDSDNVADFYRKVSDPNFNFLLHNISTKGFRVPVCISKDYDNPRGGLTFGNGHHRLLAAIFLFLDEIPVFWSDGDYMSTDYSDSEELDQELGDFENIPNMLDLF